MRSSALNQPRGHQPRHVHGFAGGTELIVDLRLDGTIVLAERKDVIRPANAKRSAFERGGSTL